MILGKANQEITRADVLLIVPPHGFVRYPNLGLGYLAAVLETKGIAVRILDCVANDCDEEGALTWIGRIRPRIVGITTYSTTTPQVRTLVLQIRRRFPHVTVVLGGAHFEVSPVSLVDFDAHFAFHGDCEYSFADFCQRELGATQVDDSEIPGLIYRRGGKLTVNDKVKVDLDRLPMPARHLFPLERYRSLHNAGRQGYTFSIITSRGCARHCIYCCNNPDVIRYRSAGQVVSEMEKIQKIGAGYVEFVDEMFVVNRQRVKAICEGIVQRGIRVPWGVQTPVHSLRPDLVASMAEAGCVKISVGIESGSERIRRLIGKPIKPQTAEALIRQCHDNGIEVLTHYIFGHPTETYAEMRRTILFACRLNSDYADFHQCVVLPGTQLFRIAVSEGKLSADHWRRYALGKTEIPLYIPDGISRKRFNYIYRAAFLVYYIRPQYVLMRLRALTNARRLRQLLTSIGIFINVLLRKGETW